MNIDSTSESSRALVTHLQSHIVVDAENDSLNRNVEDADVGEDLGVVEVDLAGDLETAARVAYAYERFIERIQGVGGRSARGWRESETARGASARRRITATSAHGGSRK